MLGGATKPVDLQIEEKIDAWKKDGRLVDPTSFYWLVVDFHKPRIFSKATGQCPGLNGEAPSFAHECVKIKHFLRREAYSISTGRSPIQTPVMARKRRLPV